MIPVLLAFGLFCGALECRADAAPWDGTVTLPGPAPAGPALTSRFRPTPAQSEADRWFGSDKLQHFVTAFAATGFAHAGLRVLDVDRDAAVGGGVAFALVAGIGKEIYDVRVGRAFSLRDLAWDIAGAGVGALLAAAAR